MSDVLLKVEDLNVYYGMIQALRGISFEVNRGEIVSLIGANGAGKTTTLHTITGLIHPKSGSVCYKGQEITHTRVRSLGKILQGRSPGKGNDNPLQYSCLENPMDGEAW